MSNDERNIELIDRDITDHARFVSKQNRDHGAVLKRHLDNLVRSYGARYTTEVILELLKEEIKAIKQSKKAQKVG